MKYMLRSYLRTRLHKVERFVFHCIDDAAARARLSEKEDAYAQDYLIMVGNHLKSTVANKLPGGRILQAPERTLLIPELARSPLPDPPHSPPLLTCRLHRTPLPPTRAVAFSSLIKQASAHPAPDMIAAPDTSRHVFCRVLRDLGQVQVYEDGGTHELNRGDLYIMRYRMLAPLLEQGSVQLI